MARTKVVARFGEIRRPRSPTLDEAKIYLRNAIRRRRTARRERQDALSKLMPMRNRAKAAASALLDLLQQPAHIRFNRLQGAVEDVATATFDADAALDEFLVEMDEVDVQYESELVAKDRLFRARAKATQVQVDEETDEGITSEELQGEEEADEGTTSEELHPRKGQRVRRYVICTSCHCGDLHPLADVKLTHAVSFVYTTSNSALISDDHVCCQTKPISMLADLR